MDRVNWNEAPQWAEFFGVVGSHHRETWYNQTNYTHVDSPADMYDFGGLGYAFGDIKCIQLRPSDDVNSTTVNWDEAPSWATSYGVVGIDKLGVWYDLTDYIYVDEPDDRYVLGVSGLGLEDITHVSYRPTTTDNVNSTVEQRGENYGRFDKGAKIMQDLKNTIRSTPNWENLTHSQREALEMIQHKIGRILNGDPNYIDNWHDIQGYAYLVEEELKGNVK